MKTQSINMGMHTKNVMSQLAETGTQNREPVIKMPVTLNYYTDRYAATIIEISSNGKSIKVQQNKVKTIDYYAGKYEVLPELEGDKQVFTKRKNGRWVKHGESLWKGLGLSLGIHNHYIDPTF